MKPNTIRLKIRRHDGTLAVFDVREDIVPTYDAIVGSDLVATCSIGRWFLTARPAGPVSSSNLDALPLFVPKRYTCVVCGKPVKPEDKTCSAECTERTYGKA